MNSDFSDLDPVERMALAHARHDVKAAWAALLKLDAKLATIVLAASEPLIAQMKLVWWRDAILESRESRPKGEPMLAELSLFEEQGDFAGIGQAMTGLVDAWGLMLAHETWSEDVLKDFARQRSGVVFGAYLKWTGRYDSDAVGEEWAWNDLAVRSGEKLPDPIYPKQVLPRPLSILTMAARQQRDPRRLSGIRLVLHGLTGL